MDHPVSLYADIDALMDDVNFLPNTRIEVEIERFLKWYVDYCGVDETEAKGT